MPVSIYNEVKLDKDALSQIVNYYDEYFTLYLMEKILTAINLIKVIDAFVQGKGDANQSEVMKQVNKAIEGIEYIEKQEELRNKKINETFLEIIKNNGIIEMFKHDPLMGKEDHRAKMTTEVKHAIELIKSIPRQNTETEQKEVMVNAVRLSDALQEEGPEPAKRENWFRQMVGRNYVDKLKRSFLKEAWDACRRNRIRFKKEILSPEILSYLWIKNINDYDSGSGYFFKTLLEIDKVNVLSKRSSMFDVTIYINNYEKASPFNVEIMQKLIDLDFDKITGNKIDAISHLMNNAHNASLRGLTKEERKDYRKMTAMVVKYLTKICRTIGDLAKLHEKIKGISPAVDLRIAGLLAYKPGIDASNGKDLDNLSANLKVNKADKKILLKFISEKLLSLNVSAGGQNPASLLACQDKPQQLPSSSASQLSASK